MTTYSRSFLYEKYKNDCVSREEFSKLADLGILCRPEEYAFPTTVSVGDGKNTPRFSGETAHILAGKRSSCSSKIGRLRIISRIRIYI